MTHRSSQRRACRPRGSSSGLTDLSTGPSVTSHFPVQTLSQANSNYQDPRNLEQGLLLACWTDVGPCNWAPPPLGPGLLCKLGFPGGSVGKKYACNAGEPSLIPGSGRSTGEGTGYPLQYPWASLVVQLVKNPPAMQEPWVQSLGWEDPLEKGKATHSSILAWRISWTIQSMGSQRAGHN